MKTVILKSITAIFSLLLLFGTSSCKKENTFTDLTGQWSNVRSVGTFLNVLTQLKMETDGSATETVMNITTSTTTTVSERDLTWKVENENELVLQESGQSEERFTFSLEEENKKLVLTAIPNGSPSEYFKDE